jgi:hypothetical protein
MPLMTTAEISTLRTAMNKTSIKPEESRQA